MTTPPGPLPLADFNAADSAVVHDVLGACLDIPEWITEVGERRPYASLEQLYRAASEASAKIDWNQVASALARHPRIGETSTGSATDRSLSSSEQSGVAESHLDDLATANAAYERRFGHIFLICAAGLTGKQILAALRERMTNDTETERGVVISELRKIGSLRLTKAVTA